MFDDLFSKLNHLAAIRRSRLALRRLTDDQLRDINLTRSAAEQEASRSPWDHQSIGGPILSGRTFTLPQ